MLRAIATVEKAGIPSVALVCEGFLLQAAETIQGLGMPDLRYAKMPGHPDIQALDELRENVMNVTLEEVASGLSTEVPALPLPRIEYEPREIVFTGTPEEIDEHFYDQEWSDGLPFVPPTIERVERFLRYTDLPPEQVVGVMLPDNRAATIWSVAVNGVMAGCRPEYMPILIAIVEALADPEHTIEHAGNTPGSDHLIVVNGPIVRELGFNYTQGALRDGFRPNTSVGRFLRLYLRNVVGFLPHKTDKATFGNTWRVVLAENEPVLQRMGWDPLCTDAGIKAGANAVTIGRYTSGSVIASVVGPTPEAFLPYIADAVLSQTRWELIFTAGTAFDTMRPLLILSPIIALRLARAGWSRDDLKQYLFDHCRHPAWKFERYVGKFSGGFYPGRTSLLDMVQRGEVPPVFGESPDPARLVPIVFEPSRFMIAVSGDPGRTNAYTFTHNGRRGCVVGKEIRLPKNWESLPKRKG